MTGSRRGRAGARRKTSGTVGRPRVLRVVKVKDRPFLGERRAISMGSKEYEERGVLNISL